MKSSQTSSQLNSQNELIQSLRKQVAAKEQELANEKWLFEQYLQSPSWRLTYPLRWLAKKLRALRKWIMGAPAAPEAPVPEPEPAMPVGQPPEPDAIALQVKDSLTALCQVKLQSCLSSGASFQVPHSESPEVSIILVLFNRAELTLACLRSIVENHAIRTEVIIVDNCSSDKTPQLLNCLRGARIIRNSENLNFVLTVNQAAREARGEYLLILNNDTQLLPGTLGSALNTIRSASDIGAVGGRLILLDGTLQEAGSMVWRDGSCLGYGRGDDPFAPAYMFRRDVDYCSAAFLLTPRATWERLGGFDEVFEPAYYEEADYCARLWEQGLRVVYDPNAVLLHYEFAGSASDTSATDLQREHQQIFAARHQAMLSNHHAMDLNAILPARMRDGRKRVLFIDDRIPHTWLGSGFPRSRSILKALVEQGYFVTFYPLDFIDEDWSSVYSDMPAEVEFITRYGPPLLETFLRHRKGYYDTIFVSRPHNMNILQPILAAYPDWFADSSVIYDAEAVFTMRTITRAHLNGVPVPQNEAARMLKEEMALAAHADGVVSVSDAERQMFRKHGIDTVHVLGHVLAASPTSRPFQERSGFLFAGAMREEASPNVDSITWFVEEIFPAIQARLGRDVTLTIAGDNKLERVRNLAGPSVHLTGPMPDLTEVYNSSRVFVAPTRYAAGIPHKVHEAAAHGLPVVGTSLLASQLGWPDDSAFLAARDAESFAAKCIQLYTDEAVWTRLREAGLERIRTECSRDLFDSQLKTIMRVKRARLAKVGMAR